jgi:hypothetical protein
MRKHLATLAALGVGAVVLAVSILFAWLRSAA